MSKYIAEFTSINSVNYKIEIETEKGTNNGTFLLGETPITTQMDSDGKTIYAPIKSKGATITIVTNTLPFDIYSGKSLGTKVKLTNTTDNKVEYVGYVTPCAYSQYFDNPLEELEIECVDGIAVLKDIPYISISADHDIATFGDIIFNIFKRTNIYKNLYVSDNVQLTANGNQSVIDIFRVSEQNFFDSKDDIEQTDIDVAWNCYDVLFELMQYLGYSMFADGEDIFIIDYDAIKRGNNKYFKYSLTGDKLGNYTEVTQKYSYYIKEGSYSENGTKISLDEVYNKVTVKDEYNTFDSIFPEFGDENFETNITLGTEDIGMRYYFGNNTHYTNMVGDCFTATNKKGKSTNYQILTVKGWKNKMWLIIVKFYNSPVLEFKKYEHRTKQRKEETADFEKDMSWSRIWNAHGATYYKIYKREISSKEFNSWRSNYASDWQSMTVEQRLEAWKTFLNNDPQNISLEPLILMYDYNTQNKIEWNEVENFPYIKMKSSANPASFGGEGAYLIIKGSVCYHDEDFTPFPMSNGANNGDLKRKEDWKIWSECYLPAMLKWGDKYWNGEGWSNDKTTFPLYWRWEEGREAQKNKNIYDKFFDIIDTAQSKYGCTEKGVYIPCPEDTNLTGGVEFVIYANRDMDGKSRRSTWSGRSRYYSKVLVIKNLKIEAKISNGILDDQENDSDTIYTNITGNDSVKNADEITFKVCTNDNKKPSYSVVDYLNNGQSVYVTKTFNKALNSLENGSISALDGEPNLTQEEHLIFKIVTQYQNPMTIFEVNLKNENHKLFGTYTDKTLSNKTFIASEINTDYRFNKQSIKLIEKV